jgi:hypothetical protein
MPTPFEYNFYPLRLPENDIAGLYNSSRQPSWDCELDAIHWIPKIYHTEFNTVVQQNRFKFCSVFRGCIINSIYFAKKYFYLAHC